MSEVVFIVVFLLLVYMYLTRKHNYWSSRGVPGPRPLPFFGTYFQQFCVPFQDSEMERFNEYGPIYGIFDGTEPGLIVGRPDLVKEIMTGKTAQDTFIDRRPVKTTHPIMAKFLSSLESEMWKRVRSIIAPTFSSGKLRTLVPTMDKCSEKMIEKLMDFASKNKPVDFKMLFGDYTMDVIALTAFATNPTAEFATQAALLFTFPFWRKFMDYIFPMWLLELIRFTVLPPKPMKFFRKITIDIIQNRRRLNIQEFDFLQLLMEAQNEALKNSKYLSNMEILSQAVLFFSVGFETSSQVLTYTAYLLALHPDIQQQVCEEIDGLLARCAKEIADGMAVADRLTRPDYMKHLPYLTAVIKESLRLHNPVLRMERKAARDYVLGDTGITVPKGMIIGIPVYAMHHSADNFPAPFEFQPERFTGNRRGDRDAEGNTIYLPFGQGPRDCIGKRFAMLEIGLALIDIFTEFKFVPVAETKVPLEFYPTGRPLLGPKSVIVGVERRQKSL